MVAKPCDRGGQEADLLPEGGGHHVEKRSNRVVAHLLGDLAGQVLCPSCPSRNFRVPIRDASGTFGLILDRLRGWVIARSAHRAPPIEWVQAPFASHTEDAGHRHPECRESNQLWHFWHQC